MRALQGGKTQHGLIGSHNARVSSQNQNKKVVSFAKSAQKGGALGDVST
jgi:hypothetical protein